MKGILINGSPKSTNSASGILLSDLKSLLNSETEIVTVSCSAAHPAARAAYTGLRWEPSKEELAQFSQCSFLVLFFPLYVDGLPSHLLSFLSELEWQAKHCGLFQDQEPLAVYAVANCGFYEGSQTRHALRMVENWCVRCGFQWKQGIGCGAGGMLPETDHIPVIKRVKKTAMAALKDMASNIEHLRPGTGHLISLNVPRLLYITAAHGSWKKQGRSNNLNVKELKS